MGNQGNEKPERQQRKNKKDGFLTGIISLISKQCIFSAMIFSAVYYIKNAGFSFSEPVSAFIKETVGFEMTIETILSFLK